MKKILVTLLVAVLILSVVSCNKTPPDVPDNTENNNETISVVDQLLSYDNYDVFEDEIYLCDDVYRSDDTSIHGTASIALPMAQDVLELKDYDILLCGDGCSTESVVSRASQGYAPAYHVVSDGEIDGNFRTLKFKMEIPEGMLEDVKKQGVYDQIIEELGGQYYYLLVLDEKHYAYIQLERTEGVEKIEDEAELADGIVKNAKINFEPKNEKLDLTIERVIRLAENKGEELTWSDFQMYNAIETGSGLYILVYDIDETFDVMIGGVPNSSPMYIRLVTKADRGNYIDIRTEDVEKFISENREEKSATETSELLCGYPKASYFTPVTLESITKDDVSETEHHIFVKEESEYTQYLLLQPGEELSDISLSLMDITDEGLVPGETLYTLDKLNIEKPLVVGVVFYGDLTAYGLSFNNASGKECNYIIYTSGKDGSVILQKAE